MQSFLGATLVMPKSDPWEDEALPVLPALGPVSVRKADTCRSPPPYRPAGSFLAARPSPPCGWCGRCRDRACQRGRSLPAESAIGRVLSYGSPLLATNVAAVDEKRPVIRFQKSSKVLNGLDVNESRGDIPIRRVSHRCPGTYPAARRRDCHAQLSGLRCAAVLCTEPEKGPHAGRTTKGCLAGYLCGRAQPGAEHLRGTAGTRREARRQQLYRHPAGEGVSVCRTSAGRFPTLPAFPKRALAYNSGFLDFLVPKHHQTVRTIVRSLRGRSGAATNRSKPSDISLGSDRSVCKSSRP
jgi:hypothetical protein